MQKQKKELNPAKPTWSARIMRCYPFAVAYEINTGIDRNIEASDIRANMDSVLKTYVDTPRQLDPKDLPHGASYLFKVEPDLYGDKYNMFTMINAAIRAEVQEWQRDQTDITEMLDVLGFSAKINFSVYLASVYLAWARMPDTYDKTNFLSLLFIISRHEYLHYGNFRHDESDFIEQAIEQWNIKAVKRRYPTVLSIYAVGYVASSILNHILACTLRSTDIRIDHLKADSIHSLFTDASILGDPSFNDDNAVWNEFFRISHLKGN